MKARKILIADDDPEVTRMLSIGLRNLGFDSVVARDAMQSLMYAKHESPVAMLLDVMMPGGNGLEVLRRLRSADRTKSLPVIVISATADETLPDRARQLGAEFLPKPIQFDQLVALLRRMAPEAPPSEPAADAPPAIAEPDTPEATAAAIPVSATLAQVGRQVSSCLTRILVAEDDPTQRRLLEKFLVNWDFQVVLAEDGAQALHVLESADPPRFALLDWMMPGLDGPQVCRRLRQKGPGLYAYVVMLTAKGQKQDIVEGLESGADDYLIKPFHPAELKARLRAGLRILELQEQLTAACNALEIHATRDALTGLWNRRTILEMLDRELARTRRERRPLALLLVDLDHFKQLNDTHGHLAGDAALHNAGQWLAGCLRRYDAVGRYGGEEFLVVAPDCDSRSALGLGDRLRASITAGQIPGLEQKVTASIGVAVFEGKEGTLARDLVAAADAALYEAKRKGRNRVELAPAALVQASPGVPVES